MGKMRLRISSRFRSEERTMDFAMVLSVLLSLRKQGRNRFRPCWKGPRSCPLSSLPNGRPSPLAWILSGRGRRPLPSATLESVSGLTKAGAYSDRT